MGIDYSVSLALGFRVTQEEIRKVFGVKQELRFHMEPRFDPKTGARLKDEKVIDQDEGVVLMWDGEDIMEFELVEELARKIGCSYWIDGTTGWSDDRDYILGPDLPEEGDGVDEGRITVGAGCSLSKLLDASFRLNEIKAGLERFGFTDLVAEVVPALWIS